MAAEIGQPAPEFTLKDQNGNDVSLADFRGQKSVALVFYPFTFTGVCEGELFMLRVRGESMIDAGILDGDFVVARVQNTAEKGDIVVAGIPGDEATVKGYRTERNKVVLVPHNPTMSPMVFDPSDVTIFGRVVSVLRKL